MEKKITDFEEKVIEKLRAIPKGKVTTYGFLARTLRRPKSSRAVGNAVGKNPFAPKAPCHRVVKADGIIGGYSGNGGVNKKIDLLSKEGIEVKKGRIVDFEQKLYKF